MKKKFSHNDNLNVQQSYVAEQFFSPGVNIQEDTDIDKMENKQRNGDELRVKKRKNRIKKLKDVKEKQLNPPSAFFLNGPPGVEGLYTSPMEYYSGSILDEIQGLTLHQDRHSHQYASSRIERLKIRAEALRFIIKR